MNARAKKQLERQYIAFIKAGGVGSLASFIAGKNQIANKPK